MINVVGVSFRNEGKITYFDPDNLAMPVGSHVIVNTERGVSFATVIMPPKEVDEKHVRLPLYKVLRLATDEDMKTNRENADKEKEAYRICREKIALHGLEMKLVDVEYMFDRSKVIFYFTADGRVDFRELIKDLAGIFRTRIELRQIGVRDETKLVGGLGICGRPLCCNMYMNEFAPVSIKMAKEQNLSLNPTKISGACGRLMCCLKNEQETYEYLNSRLPNTGSYVTTPDGLKGEVSSVSVLRQLVKVIVEVDDEKEIREYPVDELTFRSKRKDSDLSEEEKEQLKGEGFGEELLEEKPAADENGKDEASENKNNRRGKNKNGGGKDNREFRDNKYNKENRDNKDNGENKDNRDNVKDGKDGKDGRDSNRNRKPRFDNDRKNGNNDGQKKEGFNKEHSKDFVREQNKDKNIDKNHYRDGNREQGKNFHNKNYKNRNKNYNGNRKGGNGGNGGHKDGGNEG